MPLNKPQLRVLNDTNFPDNTSQLITPELLRDFNDEMITSLQLTQSMSEYAVLSGSNAFVGNQNITGNLTVTGTLTVPVIHTIYETASVIYSSGSNQFGDELTDTQTLSGSVKIQGNLTINGIPLSSGSDLTSLNAFTASQNTKNATLATYTASVDTKFTTIGTYTASNDTKWNTLSGLTGSYATTGSNRFTGNQYIDKANVLYTNGIYWTSSAVGYNNLEIINSATGNLDLAALNGRVRVVSSSLDITNGTFTSSLQQGYVWVGDGSGRTTTVATSSLGGTTDLSSLNAFTQSQNTKNSTLATYTASVDTKFSTIGTQSGSWDNTSLNAFSASQITKDSTLATYTASVDTKFTAVGSSTASLNSYTSSQDTKNSTLSTYTASVDQKFSNLGSQSGSWDNTALNSFTQSVDTKFTAVGVSTASLNSYTASQDTKNSTLATYTASVDQKFSNIGSQSGSWVTESETGSFAYIDRNNSWSANQTFTNITAVSASFTYVQTLYETSSVIYSSGSNQFGDELTDIQTLSGSVKIQGNLTINGTPVLTSSADISSLNAFTQSQETKNNTLGSYTASVDTKFVAVGSSTASLNSYTSSQDTKNSTLGTYTASVDTKFSTIGTQSGSWDNTALNSFTQSQDTKNSTLATYTGSNDTKWNTLGGQTGSYVTSGITGSSLITASVSLNTITFTKGDASTFNITVNTGSAVTTDISSLNSFTQSQDTKNSTLASYTASVDTKFSTIGTQSGSWDNTSLNSFTQSVDSKFIAVGSSTASLNAYTQSNDTKWSTLGGLTGSYVTSAITGSSLVTASFSGNTLTFTKGDSSTFGVVIPDVSGSTIPAGTISGSSQITALGFVSSSVTGSSLITGSVAGNVLTFTKGDATQFSLTVETGSSVTSLPAGLLSSSVTNFVDYSASVDSRINGIVTGTGFATTGSNIFIGDQTITGSVNVSGGEHLFIKRSTAGGENILRLGVDDNGNNFQFLVTGSGTNPGQPVWGINTMGGIWGNSFDAGVVFNSYVTASQGLNVGDAGTFSAPLQNGYVWVGNSSGRNTTAPTSSFGGSTDTGSLLVTASFNNTTRNITFTKGDASTFNISGFATTGSNSGNNRFVGEQQITSSLNALTLLGYGKRLNFGDTSQADRAYLFLAESDGNNQGTLLSFSGQNSGVAFAVNDTATPSTGSTPVSFENQSRSGSILFNNSGNTGTIKFDNATGSIQLKAGGNISISGSGTTIQDFTYPTTDGTSGQVLTTNGSKVLTFTTVSGGGGGATLGANTFTGSQTLNANNNVVSGSITFNGTSVFNNTASLFNSVKLNNSIFNQSNFLQIDVASGSIVLQSSVGASGISGLSHLSSSGVANNINLVFKPNNQTGDTIISGSNNIFTNPAAVTTGYKRYIGGSNNLYLNSNNGINSQVTQSATTVSGARPVMNNNIFNGTGNFSINQAVNSGTHTYGQNIIGGTTTTTINALGFTGSLNFNSNISTNGTITINAASASVAEITSGLSGSGTVTVSSNGIFGGGITNISPRTLLTSVTQTVGNNVLAGGGITITNISSSAAVSANNNVAPGAMNYSNAGAAGLGLHTTAGSMNSNIGALNFIASASAINAANNISPASMAVTNRMFSGSIGVGTLTFNNNQIQGATNTYTITGSYGGTAAGGASMLGNGVFGSNNTIFTNVEGRGMSVDFRSNLVGGANLILTGSNNNSTSMNGGAYFGRFNANDGLRNGTAENIFVVGTGMNDVARKTGFLIDSGSNTFIEGSLNVSGSSSFTGSVKIIGATTISGSLIQSGSVSIQGETTFVNKNGNNTSVILGQFAMSDITGSVEKSVAIGQGAMRYASGSSLDSIAIGFNTLPVTTGVNNFALGSQALAENTSGGQNTAIGTGALNKNTIGIKNTAIGDGSGFSNVSGSNNTYIGPSAGNNIFGGNNLLLGGYQGVGEVVNNNIILSTGGGSIKAQYNETAWLMEAPVNFTTGSNQQAGTAVLDGGNPGTVVVSNSLVTADSIIMLTKQTLTNAHMVAVSSKGAGTFTITSNGNGDGDTVGWFIINNS